jgi:hypothetical protein
LCVSSAMTALESDCVRREQLKPGAVAAAEAVASQLNDLHFRSHGFEEEGAPAPAAAAADNDDATSTPCFIDALEEGVMEAVLSHLFATDLAALATTSSSMRALIQRAPLKIRVNPEHDHRSSEATLDALPTLSPNCAELDLTGAGAMAGDEAIARCVRRMPALRAVTLDACHKVSRATLEALMLSSAGAGAAGASGGGRRGIEAASLQRCFGLTNGADVLAAALGWHRTSSSSVAPPPCPLRALSLTHLEAVLPPAVLLPAVRGGRGQLLSCLSLTNTSFACSAGELVRALAVGAPRLEVLGLGGSVFEEISRSRRPRRGGGGGGGGGGEDDGHGGAVSNGGDGDSGSGGSGDDDEEEEEEELSFFPPAAATATQRAAELAGAFTALLRLRALECTFGNPEDPFEPASSWLAPAVRQLLEVASTSMPEGSFQPSRAWQLWDLSDPQCVLALQRRGVVRHGSHSERQGKAAVLRAAANCTPPKRFKATPLHMAVAASPADPRQHQQQQQKETAATAKVSPRCLLRQEENGGGVVSSSTTPRETEEEEEEEEKNAQGEGDGDEDEGDDGDKRKKGASGKEGEGNDVFVAPGPWRGRRQREARTRVVGAVVGLLRDRIGGVVSGNVLGGGGGGWGGGGGFDCGRETASSCAVHALIRMGADVNARDRSGANPLFLAAEGGRGEAVRILLAAGAEPAARNNLGESALYIAALKAGMESQGGQVPMTKVKYRCRSLASFVLPRGGTHDELT